MLADGMYSAAERGLKTVTRRVMNPQPSEEVVEIRHQQNTECVYWGYGKNTGIQYGICDPYYPLNTIVYVKEPFLVFPSSVTSDWEEVVYKRLEPDIMAFSFHVPWRSKRTMAARYARNYISIRSAWPEKIGDITEEDARLEGCGSLEEFYRLWKKLHKQEIRRGCAPWVWRYEFRWIDTGAVRKIVRKPQEIGASHAPV